MKFSLFLAAFLFLIADPCFAVSGDVASFGNICDFCDISEKLSFNPAFDNPANRVAVAQCFSFIEGAAGATVVITHTFLKGQLCIPSTANAHDLEKIVIKVCHEQPELRPQSFASVFTGALFNSFPCSK